MKIPANMRHRQQQVVLSTCEIQRIWRGVLARRTFSDSFLDSVEASLGPPSAHPCDRGGPSTALLEEDATPSLEEAQEEASYKYNHHMAVSSHCSCGSSTRRASDDLVLDPSTPGSRSAVAKLTASVAVHSPPASQMRWASTAALRELSPVVHSVRGAATPHAASPGSQYYPSVCDKTAVFHLPSHPRVDAHREVFPGDGSSTSGFEFTEEMAESMSTDALRELCAVLTRIICSRNKELVGLLERRDELRHERDYREKTVTALVAQVKRSTWISDGRRKAK